MVSSVVPRLKREQYKRTKHDSNFSQWKILIGPSDWEDYLRGKEGSARYRIHNLPEKLSPGVYELGIAVSRVGLGREVYKLNPDRVVVVYLGKADNVRTRLQQYGRTGAHLGNTCLPSKPGDGGPACAHKGKGFFEEIFAQGYPVVYRWAPMQNEEDAKKTESQLLSVFDYAWNTSNNGIRRQDDIIQRINEVVSGPTTFSNMTKLLQPFTLKQVGIRIKSSGIPSPEGKSHEIDRDLSRVFKFGRSNPRLVQDAPGVIQENTTRCCGVVLGDGSVCTRLPVERRMRCAEHKGMRINGPTSKRTIKSEKCASIEFNVPCDPKSEDYVEEHVPGVIQDNPARLSGVVLGDGSVCTRPPAERRMRCVEHKGMRIKGSTSKRAVRSENNLGLKLNVPCHLKSESSVEYVIKDLNDPGLIAVGNPLDDRITNICGIILSDGTPCKRPPVKGRKRCHEHKGKRINLQSESSEEYFIKDLNDPGLIAVGNPLDDRITNICGVILSDGTPCKRPPVKGRKRCHEHKGKRINLAI